MTSHDASNAPTTTTTKLVIKSRITRGIGMLLLRGGRPNTSAAARESLQWLRAEWNGRRSKQEVVPRNRKLKGHEESAVCRLNRIGLHARLFMIADCANAVLRCGHVGEGPPPQTSEHWARRSLELHPEYYVRKQSVQETDRKKAQDPDTILWWPHEFKRICDEYGIKQCGICSFDESGFRIVVRKNQKVAACSSDRQSQLSPHSNTNQETVTVFESTSGDYVSPPMVIVSGVLHQERWSTATNIGGGTLISVLDPGNSNDALCFEWIKHFKRFTTTRQHGKWRLLLLCSAVTAEGEILDYCDDHHTIPSSYDTSHSHLICFVFNLTSISVRKQLIQQHGLAVQTSTNSNSSQD